MKKAPLGPKEKKVVKLRGAKRTVSWPDPPRGWVTPESVEMRLYFTQNRSFNLSEILSNYMANGQWFTLWALSKGLYINTLERRHEYEASCSVAWPPVNFWSPTLNLNSIAFHAKTIKPGLYPDIKYAAVKIADALTRGRKAGWIEKAEGPRERQGYGKREGKVFVYRSIKPLRPKLLHEMKIPGRILVEGRTIKERWVHLDREVLDVLFAADPAKNTVAKIRKARQLRNEIDGLIGYE